MKHYSQFLSEMKADTVVFAFGRFSPPTSGHGLLINIVKQIAKSHNADYVIYASRTQDKKKNPLPVDRKIHYLNIMFPNTNFKPASDSERTFMEVAKGLNTKYRNLIMIAGSDRVPEYERFLNQYNGKDFNFDSISVVSAGERDPDSDSVAGMSATKMRGFASEGDIVNFKKGLPSTMKDVDAKALMNDVRSGMGLDVIKETFMFKPSAIREQYFRKEIFNLGDLVESDGIQYEIIDRRNNYVTVVDSEGNTSKKWLEDIRESDAIPIFTSAQFRDDIQNPNAKQIKFKGYTSKHFNRMKEVVPAFQETIRNMGEVDPITVLEAIKATDEYLGLTVEDIYKGGKEDARDLLKWNKAHLTAKRKLERMGEFAIHAEYWHVYKDMLDKAVYAVRIVNNEIASQGMNESVNSYDQIKVAKVFATIMGVSSKDKSPEQIVNAVIKKSKSLAPDMLKTVSKMISLADEVGINYDKDLWNTMSKNITEELNSIAADRAERYGRKYPNPIDEAWLVREAVKVKCKLPVNAGKPLDLKLRKELENLFTIGHKDADTPPHGQGGTEVSHVGSSLTPGSKGTDTIDRMKVKYMTDLKEDKGEDETDEEIEDLIDSLGEDDYLDAYDDDEIEIVDKESGAPVISNVPVSEEVLQEVLSRAGRLKAKLRFASMSGKIERARMLALKRHSSAPVLNKRARHMAINLMKKKLARGKSYSELSFADKDRIDRVIQKKKNVIGRIAMKLVPKIRQIEKTRLSHANFTKGTE